MFQKKITKRFLLRGIRKDMTRQEMAQVIGCSESKIKTELRRHGLKMPTRTDLVAGRKFGNLVVIRKLPGNGYASYECRCTCNAVVTLRRGNLMSGNSKSCGCSHRRQGKDSPLFKGYEEIPGDYWRIIRRAAADCGRPFTITPAYAWKLFLAQDRQCALSGRPIVFALSKRHHEQTASLDRINSAGGYTEGNVQWTHKHVNIMKRDHDQAYFVQLCKEIAANARQAA